MDYNWANEVTNLQVDITSHCNARCGACIRNQDGNEVKEELPLEHFDMEVWERLAKEDTRGWFIGDLDSKQDHAAPTMRILPFLDSSCTVFMKLYFVLGA